MAAQIWKNNFDWAFIGPVTASTHVGLENTIGIGILQISDAASAILGTLSGGDWYILTSYKRSGSIESAIEILKVLGVNEVGYVSVGECRIRVERGAEGTTPQTYVAGDLISMRLTAGGLNALASDSELAAHTVDTANPHSVTKSQVGLGNVDNTSNATERAATATLTNKTLTTPVLANPSYSGATANGGTVTTIDINGGTIDGTVIGGTTKAAGGFTDLTVTGNTTLGDSAADTVTVSGVIGVNGGDTYFGKLSVRAGTSASGNTAFFYNSDGVWNPYLQIQQSAAGTKLVASSSGGGGAGDVTIASGGVEVAKVSPTGLAVTGALSATSYKITGAGVLGSGSDYYIGRYLNGFLHNVPTGGAFTFGINHGDKVTIDAAGLRVIGDVAAAAGGLITASYTSATRPAHAAGKMIYVSNGGAGAVFQGSNGSAWVNLG